MITRLLIGIAIWQPLLLPIKTSHIRAVCANVRHYAINREFHLAWNRLSLRAFLISIRELFLCELFLNQSRNETIKRRRDDPIIRGYNYIFAGS